VLRAPKGPSNADPVVKSAMAEYGEGDRPAWRLSAVRSETLEAEAVEPPSAVAVGVSVCAGTDCEASAGVRFGLERFISDVFCEAFRHESGSLF